MKLGGSGQAGVEVKANEQESGAESQRFYSLMLLGANHGSRVRKFFRGS